MLSWRCHQTGRACCSDDLLLTDRGLHSVSAKNRILLNLHQIQFGNEWTPRSCRHWLLCVLDRVHVLALDLLGVRFRIDCRVTILLRRVLVAQRNILWQLNFVLAL